jgi:DNA polymerase III delta subunit
MLFVYYGSDVTKVRREAHKKANEALASGGESTVISSENGSGEMLADALGATSLFRSHEVFVLDTLSEDDELFEEVIRLAPAFGESRNTFIVIEGPLLAGPKKSFSANAESCVEYTKVKKEWNAFALSDALLNRDKKSLWILLQEAWKRGEKTEAIIGTLLWQLKVMRLVEVTKNADEAGQKPFVYDKAKRALKHFKDGEVTKLSHDLIMRYHEGHVGKRNIDHALEAWVLSL